MFTEYYRRIIEHLRTLSLDPTLVKWFDAIVNHIKNAPLTDFFQSKAAKIILGVIVLAVVTAFLFAYMVSERDKDVTPPVVDRQEEILVPPPVDEMDSDLVRYCKQVLRRYWVDKTNGQIITPDQMRTVRECQKIVN